jgi:integrase
MKGTIRERSKGVWELRVYTGRDPITKRPRQVSRTFHGGKRDANTELAKMVTEQADGRRGGTNCTLEVLLDAWLAEAKTRISPVSYAVYEDSVNRIKTTDIVLVRLNRLGPHDVDQCYSTLREGGTTDHVMVQVHRYLRAALNKGMAWGWTDHNPTAQANKPTAPKAPPPQTTVAEVKSLVEAAEKTDPDLAVIILLASLTGLRRGELCGLRWSDVEGRTLVLRRSRVIARGAVVEKGLKMRQTGEEDRVPLDDLAMAILDRLRGYQVARAEGLGIDIPEDGWLLSHDGMGNTPRRPDAFGRQLSAAGKVAGMKTSPHKLRHFMATELLGRGTDIGTVAERLRHRDKALTLRTYTHGNKALGIAAADSIGRALSPSEQP